MYNPFFEFYNPMFILYFLTIFQFILLLHGEIIALRDRFLIGHCFKRKDKRIIACLQKMMTFIKTTQPLNKYLSICVY